MPDDPRLSHLVQRWYELQQQGRNVPAEELCADCPELLGQFQRRVRDLVSMEGFLSPCGRGPAVNARLTGSETEAEHLLGHVTEEDLVFQDLSIPGYELLGELGRGGMGIVYKARQLSLNRIVALKMILAGRRADSRQIARFRAEAEAVARLQHPNIVRIHEIGEHEGLPFISLEWIDGGSLDKHVAAKPQPPRHVAELVAILARAMHAAHTQGILHRDLKPSNVLLSRDGLPKLADFGLAKHLDGSPGATLSDTILGTPCYMAPEQAAGAVREVGPLTDVYGLGAILYELLAGQPPFRSRTVLETLERVRTAEPTPPSQWQPSVNRDLEIICLKCLQKSPRQRYGSALELAEDLQRFLDHEPIRARVVTGAERLWRWCQRNPILAGMAAVTAVVLVLLVLGGLWVADERDTAQKNERIAAAEKHARESAERAEQLAQELAVSQKYHALLNRAQHRIATRPLGWTWASLQDLKEAASLITNERDLVALRTEAAVCMAGIDVRPEAVLVNDLIAGAIAMSPQGDLLAVAQHKAAAEETTAIVRLIQLPTQKTIRELAFEALAFQEKDALQRDGARSVVFSPDGKWLVLGTRSGWLWRWDLTQPAGKPASWKAHSSMIVRLIVAPDGRSLYSYGDEGMVRRWDLLTGGKPQAQILCPPFVRGLSLSPDGKRLVAAGIQDTLQFLDAVSLQPCHPAWPYSPCVLCFSPDGRVVAFASGRDVVLLEVHTGKVVRTFQDPTIGWAHEFAVDHLEFDREGALLLSTCGHHQDCKVKLWEIASGRLVATFSPGTSGPLLATFHPRDQALVTAANGQVIRYEIGGGREQTAIAPHPQPVCATAFSADGQLLACLSVNRVAEVVEGRITLWTVADGSSCGAWPAPTNQEIDRPTPVVFHPRERVLASLTRPEGIDLWDVVTGQARHLLPAARVNAMSFSPDGQRLWSIVEQDVVQSWSWPERRVVSQWRNADVNPSTLSSLAVGKQWVVAGGQDGGTRLLRTDGQLEKVWTISGPDDGVGTVALSPDETRVVVGTQNGLVRVHRVPGGEVLMEWHEHLDRVVAVAFSPDGSLLASGSRDQTVRLYQRDGDTFRPLLTLRSPTGPVAGLCFHPDGEKLALLVGNETAVRVWHLDRLRARLADLGLMGL